MTIYTKELAILRYAIDSEMKALRELDYDLSDPSYQYTASKIAALHKLEKILFTIQYADDPNNCGVTFAKSSTEN